MPLQGELRVSKPFREPIELPDGNTLVSLRDVGAYITQLPQSEHDAKEW